MPMAIVAESTMTARQCSQMSPAALLASRPFPFAVALNACAFHTSYNHSCCHSFVSFVDALQQPLCRGLLRSLVNVPPGKIFVWGILPSTKGVLWPMTYLL